MDALTPEEMFNDCVNIILEHEGGLIDNKNDLGGITQWGISLRYLRSIGYDVNGDGIIDREDIIGLPKQDAIEIYREFWWDHYKYSAFNALEVVEKVFDLAVNMGGYAAHKLLQIAINQLNEKPIIVDGILGGLTFGAANRLDPYLLRQKLREEAKFSYIRILSAKPELEIFRNGWMNRAAW